MATGPHPVSGLQPQERDTLKAALGDKITVQESPWDCILMVAINHEKKPFDDKRVRRALTLALDRYEGSKALSQIAIVKAVAGSRFRGRRTPRRPTDWPSWLQGRTSTPPGRRPSCCARPACPTSTRSPSRTVAFPPYEPRWRSG